MPRSGTSPNSSRHGHKISTELSSINHQSDQQRKLRTKLKPPRQSKRPRPTHFLAIPLNTNSAVLSRISAFQDALLVAKTREQFESTVNNSNVAKIRGLDSSIVIDPRRFHLTVGVMTLEEEPTGEDSVEDWMDENADKNDAEGMKSAGTRPPTSVEDTRLPLGRVSPKPSLPLPNAISDDLSTVKSTSHISLNSQSPSHQGTTIRTIDDVSSPTHTTLQISSYSNWSTSTSASFAIAHNHSTPDGPKSSSAITFARSKTVKSALELLHSLKPQLDDILGVPVPAVGSPDAIVKEIRENTEVDVDQCIIPGRNQDASAIDVEQTTIKRKEVQKVLNVTLDKMDIMQQAAPPKPKVKGKEKQRKIDDELRGSSTTLGPEALLEENVDRLMTSVSPTVGDYAKNGSVATSSTNERCKLSTLADETHDVWANIMYLAPREEDEEGRKLRQVCDLVHTTFKRAGYVTESRPLKLHCTVLNTSKRKPAKQRGSPFCYSDVLASGAFALLKDNSRRAPGDGTLDEEIGEEDDTTMLPATEMRHSNVSYPDPSFAVEQPANVPARPNGRHVRPVPVHVDLGPDATVDVEEIGLWIMGSRGPGNEYISCGSVNLR